MLKMRKDRAFRNSYPQVFEKSLNMFIECEEEGKVDGKMITSSQIEDMIYRHSTLRLCMTLGLNAWDQRLMRIIELKKEMIIKNGLNESSLL
jgi:hypothetical protein